MLLGLLAVAFVGGFLPVEIVSVRSDSMAPTLRDGDRVLIVHGAAAPRGEIVVLDDPVGAGFIVKRVAAVGGDLVAIEDGVLVVDGRPVAEPWADLRHVDGMYLGPLAVPAGHLYVLGDDRGSSIDSRDFGPVPAAAVIGRAVTRIWPRPGPPAGPG